MANTPLSNMFHNIYIEEILPDNSILLHKKYYDSEKYTREELPNGDIKLIQINKITSMDQLSEYDFTYSTITCSNFQKNNFNGMLKKIYLKIGDGVKIICSSSCPNRIKTKEITEKGYKWIEELGISIQYANANNTILEIITQCIKNNITLNIDITLTNGMLIRCENWINNSL